MIIAQEKRKTNIAEYVLYMWQVEDLIRAYQFNIDLIEKNIISQFNQPEKVKEEIGDWYANIMLMMHQEGIREGGHLKMTTQIVLQMDALHQKLLFENNDGKYLSFFYQAKPNIDEFKSKLPNPDINDIEVCLDGLYALLLIRLRGTSVGKETEAAMQTFSNLLAVLSQRFREIENND